MSIPRLTGHSRQHALPMVHGVAFSVCWRLQSGTIGRQLHPPGRSLKCLNTCPFGEVKPSLPGLTNTEFGLRRKFKVQFFCQGVRVSVYVFPMCLEGRFESIYTSLYQSICHMNRSSEATSFSFCRLWPGLLT